MEEFESISTATAWELISCGAAGQGHMLQCKGKRGTWYSTWAGGALYIAVQYTGSLGTRYRGASSEEGLEHSVYRGTVQGREGTL